VSIARSGSPLLPVAAIQRRPASFSGTGAGFAKDRSSRERALLESRTLIRQLTEQPRLRDLPTDAAQAVLALRYCVLCRRNARDPMPELERRWGNILAARRYRLVVEAIGHVWPEAFAVAPPCCPRVSHDEALLAAIVGAASRGDRVHFDWLTAEMLGSDAREMLFVALENFIRARAPGRV